MIFDQTKREYCFISLHFTKYCYDLKATRAIIWKARWTVRKSNAFTYRGAKSVPPLIVSKKMASMHFIGRSKEFSLFNMSIDSNYKRSKNRRAAHFVFVQTKDELFRELETFQLASYKKKKRFVAFSTKLKFFFISDQEIYLLILIAYKWMRLKLLKCHNKFYSSWNSSKQYFKLTSICDFVSWKL